ncbi:MarR family winged helix-turn-helix transcriptional regulator [Sporosarcina siberiensis]|uniref:MarR family winged helix-turn-helix transcriptional regulator n=1 Tax=Sporosarcina siberiensis TaxID=1365606 RepID=A0ABW4SIN7_9BACL
MEEIIPIFYSLSKTLRKIDKSSCVEVSVIQSSILYELSLLNEPSMQILAEIVGMDITTFSRQINTLEKKGLIERNPSVEDRRIYRLSLSINGEEIVLAINKNISKSMAVVLTTMNEFERETVIRSLRVLSNRLE